MKIIKSSCCGETEGCAPTSSSIGRREFIKATGATAAILMAGQSTVMAGPFQAEDFDSIIPADKKLSKDWIASLYARGEPLSATGDDLKFIGMPINGICTGQVYLGGDGKLWDWNLTAVKDKKHTPKGDRYMKPDQARSPLSQGFAIQVDGTVHTLDASGFKDVRFTNHYPMATVDSGKQSAAVELRYGKLVLKEFALDKAAGTAAKQSKVELDGNPVDATIQAEANQYIVKFDSGVTVNAGQRLEIVFS